MEIIAMISIIVLAPVSLFIIILVAVKNGVEQASFELREDFINEFNIRKVNENEGHNEN